jgi:hypothetical protein
VAEEEKFRFLWFRVVTFRFIPGRGNVPIHEPKGNGSNGVAIGLAATIALSGLAGGGLGSATSGLGSVSEYGTRISRSEAQERTPRNEPDAQARSIVNSFKITSHLQRMGYHVIFRATRDDNNCAEYSDGEVQLFFREHPCRSLYREIIGIEDQKNSISIIFGMATVEMSDRQTAIGLKTLLDRADKGKIIQLGPGSSSEKYRHFSFVNSLATTRLQGTSVVAFDAQIVSGTRSARLLRSFFDNALPAMG